jgi:hypothetical protein
MANLPVKGIPPAFEKANPAEVWPPGASRKPFNSAYLTMGLAAEEGWDRQLVVLVGLFFGDRLRGRLLRGP